MRVHDLLELAVTAALDAGCAIQPFYRCRLDVEVKGDGSPLTTADHRAHAAATARLAESAITVVSEEGGDLHLDARRYWLVDPLDGTKDFLAVNDEYTVNVALVEDGAPILGIVFAPALGELYLGAKNLGAWVERGGRRVACGPVPRSTACRMATSRFHDHPDVELFATENRIGTSVAVGSALKYGRLAIGEIDVFPRLVGSSEWDTAAGQAVLEAAGGSVLDWHSGAPLRYGKPRRRNPRLLAFRAPYCLADFRLASYEPELL